MNSMLVHLQINNPPHTSSLLLPLYTLLHRGFLCYRCNRRVRTADLVIRDENMKHGIEKAFAFKENRPFGETFTRATELPQERPTFLGYRASVVRVDLH